MGASSLPSWACAASATVCASPSSSRPSSALLRAAARGPLRVMFPMVTNGGLGRSHAVVERCREHLRERGVAFNEDTKFGVMLSVPAACLTAEEFVEHGVDFFLVVGTNDLTQYTHAADRELASAEHYYRPASNAMKKLITMVMDAAKVRNVPVTICGLAVGNPANTVQKYLQLGLRSFSVSPQHLLNVKKALLESTPGKTKGTASQSLLFL